MATQKITRLDTKNISATLPKTLIDKINLFVSSKKGMNVSKALRFILEDFFNSGNYENYFPEITKNDTLIPINVYSEALKIGRAAIKSRVEKGEIKVVNIYDNEYVVAKENDYINIYTNIISLTRRIDIMTKQMIECKKCEAKVEELSKKLTKITKEIEKNK